ncbi:SDR family NAD(P)-dependent oxidoreductase [Succinivibrio faecicola]|uniref:SDR family NAD(P)-dependent oxidoreductase n=1 Tax=Succinivibrio faecicola TaxID=2820300 RepID=A0ABS7DI26_9GAMM|nr:SDR family NAD(P)-dependent oxidoreductase [Succinivibrio faecicola]MBW7570734.1 SDR family NAD(P)-dependent oxidoreductase [Succinivibrio faecicola]
MSKTVLVAGASSGIGFQVSKDLSKNGNNVILCSRSKNKLEECLNNLDTSKGQKHQVISFDFEKTDNIESVFTPLLQNLKLDGLVYCVGNGHQAKFKDLKTEIIQTDMKTNYFSFVELLRIIMNQRKQSDNQFNCVAISSVASTYTNEKYYCSYTSSKSALEGAIRVLSPELIKKNCMLCAVKPAVVGTQRLDNITMLTDDLENKIVKSGYQPGGIISSKAVSDMICYLISTNDFSFSGAIIPITSGALG